MQSSIARKLTALVILSCLILTIESKRSNLFSMTNDRGSMQPAVPIGALFNTGDVINATDESVNGYAPVLQEMMTPKAEDVRSLCTRYSTLQGPIMQR